MRDPYEILGVERNASDDAIKKAYRKLAPPCHPDKNPGDEEAEAKFKEYTEARDLLLNPEKRAHYDGFGTLPDADTDFGPDLDGDFWVKVPIDPINVDDGSSYHRDKAQENSAGRRNNRTQKQEILQASAELQRAAVECLQEIYPRTKGIPLPVRRNGRHAAGLGRAIESHEFFGEYLSNIANAKTTTELRTALEALQALAGLFLVAGRSDDSGTAPQKGNERLFYEHYFRLIDQIISNPQIDIPLGSQGVSTPSI